MTETAEQIIAAAIDYNADFMEHDISVLENGTAEIRVTCVPDIRGGQRIRAIITPTVVIDDEGGNYAAADPEVKWLRWFDGRLSPSQTAKRAKRYLGLTDAKVPVKFIDQR